MPSQSPQPGHSGPRGRQRVCSRGIEKGGAQSPVSVARAFSTYSIAFLGLLGIMELDGDAMGMTERGKDFLRELNRLYRSKEEPVHYEEVAKGLGVSKWTAYDMLKRLVASGLARSEYVVNCGKRSAGRSLIVFTPREEKESPRQASLHSVASSPTIDTTVALADLGTKLADVVGQLESQRNLRALGPLIDQLRGIEKPFTYCSHTVVLLLACAKFLGTEVFRAISGIVSSVGDPVIGLTLLSGGVLGGLLARSGKHLDISTMLASCVEKYQHYVSRISDKDRGVLYDFVKDAMSQRA